MDEVLDLHGGRSTVFTGSSLAVRKRVWNLFHIQLQQTANSITFVLAEKRHNLLRAMVPMAGVLVYPRYMGNELAAMVEVANITNVCACGSKSTTELPGPTTPKKLCHGK